MMFRIPAFAAIVVACATMLTTGVSGARSSAHVRRPASLVQALGAPSQSQGPLVPPADWLPVDTTALGASSIRVLAAWRMNAERPEAFTQNINVGVQNFAGDLDDYDRASIASIHSMASDAKILLHEKTTICQGVPAWHTIWTALALKKQQSVPIELHYEQIYVAADQQKFVATYTRATTQPDVEEARLSIRTLCNPIVPAGNAT